MFYKLILPGNLETEGWKVKIRDKERVEPPHVSIIKKNQTWRWGLREQTFLDKEPPSRNVSSDLIEHIKSNIDKIMQEWDRMYPENKVSTEVEK